uniref:Uncharacterized protein n=1 Tax=Cacopsylla melanoneura TaxID=428564 RepID=A0A8D8S6I8_9HEMI
MNWKFCRHRMELEQEIFRRHCCFNSGRFKLKEVAEPIENHVDVRDGFGLFGRVGLVEFDTQVGRFGRMTGQIEQESIQRQVHLGDGDYGSYSQLLLNTPVSTS